MSFHNAATADLQITLKRTAINASLKNIMPNRHGDLNPKGVAVEEEDVEAVEGDITRKQQIWLTLMQTLMAVPPLITQYSVD